MAISQNQALFALLGTFYGGNGTSTFALPDLQGRVAIGMGQGAGLSPYIIGESGGSETVTLNVNQLPSHNHLVNCVNAKGNEPGPGGNLWAQDAAGVTAEYSNAALNGQMAASAIAQTGGSQPVSIIQPFLALTYCIALEGIFPARS